MTTVTVSTLIAAPLEQVFKNFTDVEHAPQKVFGIKGIEMMTPGPFGPGTKWREIRDVMGHVERGEMEVTAFDRNRMYVITHLASGARIDTTFSFEPSAAGTKVSIEFNLDSQGMPPGLLAPLGWAMSGKIREMLGRDLKDLKSSSERLAAN